MIKSEENAVRVCRESNSDRPIHNPARYLYATAAGNVHEHFSLWCVQMELWTTNLRSHFHTDGKQVCEHVYIHLLSRIPKPQFRICCVLNVLIKVALEND